MKGRSCEHHLWQQRHVLQVAFTEDPTVTLESLSAFPRAVKPSFHQVPNCEHRKWCADGAGAPLLEEQLDHFLSLGLAAQAQQQLKYGKVFIL